MELKDVMMATSDLVIGIVLTVVALAWWLSFALTVGALVWWLSFALEDKPRKPDEDEHETMVKPTSPRLPHHRKAYDSRSVGIGEEK